ncbi:hypothetical protein JQ310_20170, partial [Leptospira interrogans]|nr:hypothetical protein [Leptospira interrogans]
FRILWMDSFAHRKLLNSKKMYPTGRGHASDMTLPDHPVYNDDRVLEKIILTYLPKRFINNKTTLIRLNDHKNR